MPYVVIIVKSPNPNDFRHNFFPRITHYKSDAVKLKQEVEAKNGTAEIYPVSKKCPKCNNSLQNEIPADRPNLLRCATCKTVFFPR